MKKFLTLTVTAMLMFAFAFTAYAETELNVTGQVRSRGEAVQKSFNALDDHVSTFGYLRTRVNIFANVAENASAFVQFQDSRLYGASGQSGTLTNDTNVGIHQAYLKYNLWTKENWSIGSQAGRFELNWGNQRLVGAVGWSNVGRSWEGGLLWYDNKNINVTLGGLKVLETETSDPGYNGDKDVYVLTLKLKRVNLDVLILTEDFKDTSFATIQDLQLLQRTTLAAYYKRKLEQLDLEFNVAIQGGTMAATSTTEYDIAALMFTGELGYSFDGEKNARVAVAVDFASGDDGSDPTEIKTFSNLFWTGHKFNGYMDYFLGGGPNGLIDFILRGKFDFTKGWTVGADLHLFSAAEDYPGATELTKDIGTEVDVFIKTKRVKGVALQWGVSFFTANDNFAAYKDPLATSTQSGVWAYSQATMNF